MTVEMKKRKMPQLKKWNPWKLATLFLLGFMIGGAGYLFLLARQKPEPTNLTKVEKIENQTDILNLSTNKEKVNQLIDRYLGEYLTSGKVKYDFYLENQALLKGTFKLLGYPMSFYLYFDPVVLENGNVKLKAQSLSIGALGVPISEVLNYVKRYFDIPKWIEIEPKAGDMIVHLNEIPLSGDLKVRAEKIDLIQDEIKFALYLSDKKNPETKKEQKNEKE